MQPVDWWFDRLLVSSPGPIHMGHDNLLWGNCWSCLVVALTTNTTREVNSVPLAPRRIFLLKGEGGNFKPCNLWEQSPLSIRSDILAAVPAIPPMRPFDSSQHDLWPPFDQYPIDSSIQSWWTRNLPHCVMVGQTMQAESMGVSKFHRQNSSRPRPYRQGLGCARPAHEQFAQCLHILVAKEGALDGWGDACCQELRLKDQSIWFMENMGWVLALWSLTRFKKISQRSLAVQSLVAFCCMLCKFEV